MSGGIHHLAREIEKLKRFIAEILTPDRLGGVDNALAQATEFLTAINNQDLVANIGNTLGALVTGSESISTSLEGLAAIASDLSSPAKIFMYGSVGSLVAQGIFQAIKIYLDRRGDKIMEQLLSQAQIQTTINIAQMRQLAANTLINYEQNIQSIPTEQQVMLCDTIEEAKNILQHTHPIDIRSLEIIKRVQEVIESKVLPKLYQEELSKNETFQTVLDRMTLDDLNWQALSDYTIASCNWNPLKKQVQPVQFGRTQQSYDSIRRLYNTIPGIDDVDQVMRKIETHFAKNGGNQLYYYVADSFADGSALFSRLAGFVMHLDINLGPDTNLGIPQNVLDVLIQMRAAYVEARDLAEKNWEAVGQARKQPSFQTLSPAAVDLIVARAYVRFFTQTTGYFFFPYNTPREVYNGIWDVPMGILDLAVGTAKGVKYSAEFLLENGPIETASAVRDASICVWENMTKEQVQNMGGAIATAILNHPVRMATSTVISYNLPKVSSPFGKLSSGSSTPPLKPLPAPVRATSRAMRATSRLHRNARRVQRVSRVVSTTVPEQAAKASSARTTLFASRTAATGMATAESVSAVQDRNAHNSNPAPARR